jgi:putative ABC transport system ATP-binding protein
VKGPKILFADEPTGSLDINTGQSIIELLKELNSEDLSVVMVTHALEYTKYADRVIEMKDGHISGEQDRTAGAV